MLLIYYDNFLNCFHAFVQLFRGLRESREYFLTYCCYCARGGKWSIVLNHSDFSPKSFRALGVVVSVILKILIRFGNNYAFYFEIFEKIMVTFYTTWTVL